MKSLQELKEIVKNASQEQIEHMIIEFDDNIGFYCIDKRKKKQHIINCLENCYENDEFTMEEKERFEAIVLVSIS